MDSAFFTHTLSHVCTLLGEKLNTLNLVKCDFVHRLFVTLMCFNLVVDSQAVFFKLALDPL